MQKVGGGGGNGGAISAPFFFAIALLCFACFVCFDCARQSKRGTFICLLACMSIGWKEWMPIVDTDTKGGWGFLTLSEHKCDDALGEPPHANTMVKSRVKVL